MIFNSYSLCFQLYFSLLLLSFRLKLFILLLYNLVMSLPVTCWDGKKIRWKFFSIIIIMKVVCNAALVSRRRLGAAVLPLLLIGYVCPGEAGPVSQSFSKVLRSPATYRAAEEVSLHAQHAETAEESNIRLNVPVNSDMDHMSICCLHANILDFYLNNILNHFDDQDPRMHQLHSDLGRVSFDLKERGCNVVHYRDHQHTVQFRNKLAKMEHGRGLNKAMSEIA
ncbi:uncharacterized protein LOC133472198 isoform X2 [Phyllopteryx taeniolatus]|uniref:uncharacterized protein LOC133472198 isoform X2 n=1 Tax=Phyllopteryx taeniolatus TaxID=161469 RepID=UPI002AD3A44E|nr:uncharacterized protein LOC133472198 isoform X2 [Phyllopteryx taeniolatus]